MFSLLVMIFVLGGLLVTIFSYEIYLYKDSKYKINWERKEALYLSYYTHASTLISIILIPIIGFLEN